MENPESFRPRSGFVFTGIVLVFVGIYTAQSFLYFSFQSGVTTALWAALITFTSWLIFIRPRIIIFDEGIVIINPLYEITVGWESVISIDVRYTASIRIQNPIKLYRFSRKTSEYIYAWAAPAPGRYHSRTIHDTEIRGIGIDHQLALRPGDSPKSHSGQAAAMARLRFLNFEKRGTNSPIGTTLKSNTNGISIFTIITLLIVIDTVF
jgi:hypothetical protein